MDIEWKEGAVCFADSRQWFFNDSVKPYKLVSNMHGTRLESYIGVTNMQDFQLNTIKQGDYIEASELDTEQKYNDAVEVFGLFGFALCDDGNDFKWLNRSDTYKIGVIVATESRLMGVRAEFSSYERKRKITLNQLMAIGELKRLELEKSAPKIAPDLTPDLVQNPSHYQFFEGVEVIEIIASSMTREQFKGYCLGNRIKYRLRAGNKDKLEQEIAKSDKYVELYDEHKHLCK